MILTSQAIAPQLADARRTGQLISDDAAQTIASWWYSPAQPALVALATARRVLPDLANEVAVEMRSANGDGYAELAQLYRWAVANS